MNAISTFFVSVFIGLASLFGFQQTAPTPVVDVQLGASVLPIAGSTYNLAGSGVSSSATSITLASLTIPQTGQKIQDSDLSSTFYITLEPGNRTRQELVSCTTVTQGATTATLSGCSRGLSPITPYTASTTLQFAHGGGSQVIFSDPPQLFNEFASKADDNTFLGVNRFNSYLPETSITATTSNQITNKAYVDATANAGAATSTETNGGIVELGTLAEQASSYDGGANKPTVLQTKNATSTCQVVGSYAVVASSTTGKIDKNCIDQTASYSLSGLLTSSAGLTSSATTTLAGSNYLSNALVINTVPYQFPSAMGASSTLLTTNGVGTVAWTGAYNKKLYTEVVTPVSSQTSSTTVLAVTIPGGTLGTSNAVMCRFLGNQALYIQTGHQIWVEFGYGNATTTYYRTQSTGSAQSNFEVVFYLIAKGATNSQQTSIVPTYSNSLGFVSGGSVLATDSTVDKQLTIVAKADNTNTTFAPDFTICTIIR